MGPPSRISYIFHLTTLLKRSRFYCYTASMGMHDETYSNGQRTKHLEGDMLTYFFENGEVKAKGKCVEDKMDGKWLFLKKKAICGKKVTSG